ncbi:hypothetical protein PMAYCL1PPCAC_01501, partial [Pristionchus mayeri]
IQQEPSHETRSCDLCGEIADPFFLSPVYTGASNFFNKLIELTPEQRAKSEVFIKNKWQATICWRHFKAAATEPLTTYPPT